MKKLFFRLGTNVALIVKFTATGNYEVLKTLSVNETNKGTTPLRLNETGSEVDTYIPQLNTYLKLLTVGNPTTGEGYVFVATVKEQGVKRNTERYVKIVVTTTNWTNATATAQLCDKNGFTGNKPEEIANFINALANNATGTITSVNDVDLTTAAGNGNKLGLTFVGVDDKPLGTYAATIKALTGSTYFAAFQINNKNVTAEVTVTDGPINFTATWTNTADAPEVNETTPHGSAILTEALNNNKIVTGATTTKDLEFNAAATGNGTGSITVNLTGHNDEKYGPVNIEGLKPDGNEYKGTFQLNSKTVEIAFENVNSIMTWEANYAEGVNTQSDVEEAATAG